LKSSERLHAILITTFGCSTPTLSSGRPVDDDRADGVGDEQHLQIEHDHASKVRARLPERAGCLRDHLPRVTGECDEPADDHDFAAGALDDLHGPAGEILEAQGPTPATDRPAGLTTGRHGREFRPRGVSGDPAGGIMGR
jgi:hypothetical protein